MLICKFNDLENEYPVDFVLSGHIISLVCESERLPEDTSGFKITREGKTDNWDYSEFTTVYRVIDAHHIEWSDDGSKYVPQTQKLIVSASFNDGEDAYGIRPSEVQVTVYNNGRKAIIDTLTENNDYKKSHGEKPIENEYTVVGEDIPEYEKHESGTSVYYSLQVPAPRNVTFNDVVDAIIADYEGTDKSAPLINIYASYCEQNIKNFHDVPAELQEAVNEVINIDHFQVNEDGTVSLIPIN